MKVSLNLELGELAYLKAVVEGSHSATFWADSSRTNLAIKLEKAVNNRLAARS